MLLFNLVCVLIDCMIIFWSFRHHFKIQFFMAGLLAGVCQVLCYLCVRTIDSRGDLLGTLSSSILFLPHAGLWNNHHCHGTTTILWVWEVLLILNLHKYKFHFKQNNLLTYGDRIRYGFSREALQRCEAQEAGVE